MLIEATAGHKADWRPVLPRGIFEQDVEVEGLPGTPVRYTGMHEFRGADIPPILHFVLDHGHEAGAALIAAWIVDKFRGRASKLTINRREVDLDDEGQVRRVVEEEIKIE